MANPTIKQITLPSGTTYDIEDSAARAAAGAGLQMLKCTNAADTPYGITWKDGATTITGTLVAASTTTGKFYLVPSTSPEGKDIYSEYITVIGGTSGSPTYDWEKVGDTEIVLSSLGALAYKDNASGDYTPAGSIAVNAASGTGTSFTPAGTIAVNAASGSGTSYTPEGTVSAPTITVSSAGATTNITPFGSAGTLPSLTMTVSDGNLSIDFSQGTLPSGGTAVSVKTGDATYSAGTPTFTGTEKKLAFTGTEKKLAFEGTQATVTVS